ncbi:hypothetical protein AHAS_Ahas15G0264800 [Arachis hypogaea]
MLYPPENLVCSLEDRIIMEELNFNVNALASELSGSKGGIVLKVASSGIAVFLLPNGRTAHSRFKISLTINEDSLYNIKQGSPLAKLITKAKLIICDETLMISKYCYEPLDKCLRDILRCSDSYNAHLPFGGKVVVYGGDFRQSLPMIPKAQGKI